jgi:hypothetical protein
MGLQPAVIEALRSAGATEVAGRARGGHAPSAVAKPYYGVTGADTSTAADFVSQIRSTTL